MDLSVLWQLIMSGLANGAIYGIVALGFSLVFGVTNILNLAQGEFLVLGALIAITLLQLGIPVLAAFALSIAMVTLIAAAFQRVTLGRLGGVTPEAAILITIGGGTLLRGLALVLWGPDARSFPSFSGDRPIILGGASLQPQSLWVIGLTLGLVLALWAFFHFSLVGKAMVACAQNPMGAQMVGINIRQMATVAFAMSGAMGAFTGIVMTPLTFVTYDSGFEIGLKGFVAAMIGGIGSYPGALVGGFVLGEIEALASVYLPSAFKDATSFAVLIVVLLVLPNGLLGRRRR